MGLNPGDKIDFVIREDGDVFVRPVILDIGELEGQMKTITFDAGLKNNPVFRVL